MAIVSQNAGKQGFLAYQAEIAEKLRSFEYFLCKTNPISGKPK
jgi:hypothetical protein